MLLMMYTLNKNVPYLCCHYQNGCYSTIKLICKKVVAYFKNFSAIVPGAK